MGETVNYRDLYEESRQRKVAHLVRAALEDVRMEELRVLMLEQERNQQTPEGQAADEEPKA